MLQKKVLFILAHRWKPIEQMSPSVSKIIEKIFEHSSYLCMWMENRVQIWIVELSDGVAASALIYETKLHYGDRSYAPTHLSKPYSKLNHFIRHTDGRITWKTRNTAIRTAFPSDLHSITSERFDNSKSKCITYAEVLLLIVLSGLSP